MQKDQKRTIDQQIAALKRKKRKIQQEQALILLRKFKQIFGKAYSHELEYAITTKTWQMATDQEKEVWRSNAHPFRLLNHVKAVQAGTEDPKQTPGTSAKEISTYDER